jgi:hypothetical protein
MSKAELEVIKTTSWATINLSGGSVEREHFKPSMNSAVLPKTRPSRKICSIGGALRVQTHLQDNDGVCANQPSHLKAFFRFLPNTEQVQGSPSLCNYLILPRDAIFPQVAVREQRQPFVPLTILQIGCDLH